MTALHQDYSLANLDVYAHLLITARSCNAPPPRLKPLDTTSVSARQCFSNSAGASAGLRASMPLEGVFSLRAINNLGVVAQQSAMRGAATSPRPVMLSSTLPAPELVKCGLDNTSKTATWCVAMVFHNHMGSNSRSSFTRSACP